MAGQDSDNEAGRVHEIAKACREFVARNHILHLYASHLVNMPWKWSTALSAGDAVRGQCCVASTETIRAVRDREPKTATSTFTQLMNSGNVVAVAVLYIPGTSLSSTE